ncbi:MAG TPA: hypothetical protein VFX41_01390 [Actinomycetales bacterium]|nr:hypothetical protein [Actinomycetales bacterium]
MNVTTSASAEQPWVAGAADLRLPLAEFAAVANEIPQLVLPEGFRPSNRVQPITAPEIAEPLAKAGLLLRDGDDVVLCPQLTGLLRLFERAAVTFRLRVRFHHPDDDTHVRWFTDVALAEGRGVRLTRAQVMPDACASGEGAMDGDTVAVTGFTLAELVPQLLGCVPGLDAGAAVGTGDSTGRPHREVIDVVDLAARQPEQDVGAMTLEIHSPAGQFIDVWSRDSWGWRRVLPDGAGRLVLISIGREAFAAELTDVLTESVLVDGSVKATERVNRGGRGN